MGVIGSHDGVIFSGYAHLRGASGGTPLFFRILFFYQKLLINNIEKVKNFKSMFPMLERDRVNVEPLSAMTAMG